MEKIIEALNKTSENRTIFYCVVGIVMVAIVANSIENILTAIIRLFKNSK